MNRNWYNQNQTLPSSITGYSEHLQIGIFTRERIESEQLSPKRWPATLVVVNICPTFFSGALESPNVTSSVMAMTLSNSFKVIDDLYGSFHLNKHVLNFQIICLQSFRLINDISCK